MAKYNINKNTTDQGYPYNLVSLNTEVDGKLVEMVYSVGVPNSPEYGKERTLEIYFYSNQQQMDKGEFHKSVCYSSVKGNYDKIPRKYYTALERITKVYKEQFNIVYQG